MPSSLTILIIEDENHILELLKFNLEKEGFRVLTSRDGEEGTEMALKEHPALILLDLMLPKVPGLEVCKILRQNPQTASIPVIMLTAKSEEVDKVIGLELGADDYVTKPFSPKELIARMRAVLRRGYPQNTTPETLEAGSILMNTAEHRVTLAGKTLELTSKEYNLLKTLLEAGGKVLTREVLLEQVWKIHRSVKIQTRTIDMHIRQLRMKLKKEADRIMTIKNVGYRIRID